MSQVWGHLFQGSIVMIFRLVHVKLPLVGPQMGQMKDRNGYDSTECVRCREAYPRGIDTPEGLDGWVLGEGVGG